jgi:hypothetical protein
MVTSEFDLSSNATKRKLYYQQELSLTERDQ